MKLPFQSLDQELISSKLQIYIHNSRLYLDDFLNQQLSIILNVLPFHIKSPHFILKPLR